MKRAKRYRSTAIGKPRNPVALSPLLGKGGAHGKTTRAKRRQAHVEETKLVRDPELE